MFAVFVVLVLVSSEIGSSDLVVGEMVSDNYFNTLGIHPALGRVFTAERSEEHTSELQSP